MRQYSSIEELTLTLALYPNQKEHILEEVGKWFKLNDENAFFVVVEDGNCGLFNKDYELDDLSKIKEITYEMIREDIKRINIPDSVKSIGRGAFYWCISLKSISIPDSVKSIGDNAFSNCESLESIIIPSSVKNIGDWTFSHCKSLKRINISYSVTSIGFEAFSYCTSLESIIIPDSVESIGDDAFFKCESLKEVIFKGKSFEEVKGMNFYPWGVDESIIRCEG